MCKNLSESLNMRGFKREQAKQLILKTMEDIRKSLKYSQEDQKKINGLKGEIAKRDQKIAVLWKQSRYSENFQKW